MSLCCPLSGAGLSVDTALVGSGLFLLEEVVAPVLPCWRLPCHIISLSGKVLWAASALLIRSPGACLLSGPLLALFTLQTCGLDAFGLVLGPAYLLAEVPFFVGP